MKINYSSDARQALHWIKLYHPEKGSKIIEEILLKISGLRKFPRMGMKIENLLLFDLPETYYFIVSNHIIIYEINESEKEIIILHIYDHHSNLKEKPS